MVAEAAAGGLKFQGLVSHTMTQRLTFNYISESGSPLDCVQPAAALGPRSLLPPRQPQPRRAPGIIFLISLTPHP